MKIWYYEIKDSDGFKNLTIFSIQLQTRFASFHNGSMIPQKNKLKRLSACPV